MSWVAVAIGGSAAISAGAGALQGQAEGRAGRASRDWYDQRTGAQQLMAGGQIFGGSEFADWLQTAQLLAYARQRQDIPEMERLAAHLDEIQQRGGGTLTQQLRDFANTVSARQSGNLAYYDQETGRLRGMDDELVGEFDRGAANLMRKAEENEADVSEWGAGRESIIRQDYDDALSADLDTTLADFAASGFGGSSTRINAQRDARSRNTTERSRALQDLSDSIIDRRTSARGRTLDLGRDLHFGGAGVREGRIGRAYGRSVGRMDLENLNLSRDIALHGAPIEAQGGIFQSAVMNPWLSQNTSQYYPGSSGAAAALQQGGNALGAWGWTELGQQNQLALLDRLNTTRGRGRATVEP